VAVIGVATPVAVDAPDAVIGVVLIAGAAAGAAYASALRWPRLGTARRLMVRSRRVALAAEEATFDDPAFDPATVKAAAAELHAGVVAAWSADDRKRLAELLSPELLAEWVRRLDELRRRGCSNPLRRRGRLHVRYVGLANRTGQRDDRVVVHLRARMDDAVYDRRGRIVFRDPDDSGRHTHCEFWTLGRRDGRWVLLSVETEQEGAHHLSDPIVPAPWADDRLHDLATFEQAATTTLSPATLADIAPVEFTADLRTSALDLAGFDGRFDPDVLEAAARRAVAAWAEAVDGNHDPLLAVSDGRTAEKLLYPESDRRRRLVIRGPHLEQLRIVELQPRATPPSMTVEATITARGYLEQRATGGVTAGSRNHNSTFSCGWILHLTDNPETPWRIAGIVTPPAQRRSVLYRYTFGLVEEVLDVLANRTERL
jgi:predicted lipid-binding transport protein (Tim44 family)